MLRVHICYTLPEKDLLFIAETLVTQGHCPVQDKFMGLEIERKFLLAGDGWRELSTKSVVCRQGYLSFGPPATVRVRLMENEAFLNIKSAKDGIMRTEFEYPVPAEEAGQMLKEMLQGGIVEKIRHFVPFCGHVWEIDEFTGENAGLLIAEIELKSPEEDFSRPEWLGAEVSSDRRYYNTWLAQNPYTLWSKG